MNGPDPTTKAHAVSSLASHDGTLFPDRFVAALEDAAQRTVLRQDQGDEAVRYEWEDGSAIVVCGGAWDFGVHRDRLDEAAARYEPERPARWPEGEPEASPRELVLYAWVGFGYGLTGLDAEPPRHETKEANAKVTCRYSVTPRNGSNPTGYTLKRPTTAVAMR